MGRDHADGARTSDEAFLAPLWPTPPPDFAFSCGFASLRFVLIGPGIRRRAIPASEPSAHGKYMRKRSAEEEEEGGIRVCAVEILARYLAQKREREKERAFAPVRRIDVACVPASFCWLGGKVSGFDPNEEREKRIKVLNPHKLSMSLSA